MGSMLAISSVAVPYSINYSFQCNSGAAGIGAPGLLVLETRAKPAGGGGLAGS